MMFKGALKDIVDALAYLISVLFARPEDAALHPVNDLPMNQPSVVTPIETVKKVSLTDFCLAIRDYEGSPGDRNYRNNNPGNCRFSSVGYAAIYGHVGKDAQNFAIFKDYATGWLYLKNLVLFKVKKNPDQTILQFMKVYAPVSDGNDPVVYTAYICRRLGIKSDYPMRLIV